MDLVLSELFLVPLIEVLNYCRLSTDFSGGRESKQVASVWEHFVWEPGEGRRGSQCDSEWMDRSPLPFSLLRTWRGRPRSIKESVALITDREKRTGSHEDACRKGEKQALNTSTVVDLSQGWTSCEPEVWEFREQLLRGSKSPGAGLLSSASEYLRSALSRIGARVKMAS